MLSPIILVIIVIGSLITIHEFGHLVIAKLLKLPVEQFSIGFGPVILRYRYRETEYRLSIIPLGGYIKLTGDEFDATVGFNIAPLPKKTAVILAGPIFNLLLGITLTAILYGIFGVSTFGTKIVPEEQGFKLGFLPGDEIIKINKESIPDWLTLEKKLEKYASKTVNIMVKRNTELLAFNITIEPESVLFRPYIEPIIDIVKRKSPAEKIGLQRGDRILQIDQLVITEWNQFTEFLKNKSEKKHYLKWLREDKIYEDSIEVDFIRDELTQKPRGVVGLAVKLPEKRYSPLKAITAATHRTIYIAVQTVAIIYKVITGEIPKSAIGGPVMVGKLTYEGAQWGIKYLLGLWAVLSINLCVINLFPIPILDGGRVLFYAIERVLKRRFNKKTWEITFYFSYVLIGLLVVFALFNDITRIIKK
jgi:regulator of sigma E protease